MSDFSQAFDYVHSTLHSWQVIGSDLRANRAAVQRLQSGGKVASKPKEAAVAHKFSRAASAKVMESASPTLGVEVSRIAPAAGSKAERLAAMRGPVLACTKCPNLVRFRTQVVFGVGNPGAELMFVGEAPGEDEDKQGEPFVGKAGQLLTKIIETMGLTRDSVYIANVLKCRPDMPPGVPGNRKPELKEMQTCLPYLREQIEIIQPRAIVALGATALQGLTGQNLSVGKVRGKWLEFEGIPLMVTFHPAYLLRNQAVSEKRKVWEDMLLVLEKLGHPISEKQRQYFMRA
jgi:uracil-DNA glycosylase